MSVLRTSPRRPAAHRPPRDSLRFGSMQDLTIGIEEEYMLVHRATRDLAHDPPDSLFEECNARLDGRVSHELMRGQIEIATSVCTTMAQARAEVAAARRVIAEVAAKYDLAPIAAATHPFASWRHQAPTDAERYVAIAEDLQAVGRRNLICGEHVHVGIENENLRIDVMNQVTYFLPVLLALSTSSPFWRGDDTGLLSYRVSVSQALPRSGLPEHFADWSAYQAFVGTLIASGAIEDATKLWWDIRPSARFPTLEVRIPDVCTRIDDAITIAALYRCIVHMLCRLRRANQQWRLYPRALVEENRWLAERFGIDGHLIDFGAGQQVPFVEYVNELLALISEDARALGCLAEVARARVIATQGTSAHRQRNAWRAALEAGQGRQGAMDAVVDLLIAETVADPALDAQIKPVSSGN